MSAHVHTPAKPLPALREHSRVRLRVANAGLPAGTEGAVVHVYNEGAGYEVEFVKGSKRPIVLTLAPHEIESLEGQ